MQLLTTPVVCYNNGMTTSHSKHNQLQNMKQIIIAMMIDEGRDFNTCELCGEHIDDNKYDIHHTRYDGATYKDLMIVHRKCNTQQVNRYLA